MENQRQAKNREEGGSMDRISQLPQPILHHILSFLSQNDAVRTCLLSQSWRDIGPTRPKIEFHQSSIPGNKEKFLSVLDNTLQRYVDQKLPIQEFVLWLWCDPESISLLQKWIPIVIANMGLKTFNLQFVKYTSTRFPLPSVVFQAEFLKELYLEGCNLNQIYSIDKVQLLKRLQKLSLSWVYIEDETFEKTMSSCPLIEYLVLGSCLGLRTIKVNKARNLKHFSCYIYEENSSFEIDESPSLETIRIENGPNWYHDNIYFPRLKSLFLRHVRLSKESFDSFSSNFPCLEKLELVYCSGFQEFELSSRSIKRLVISVRSNTPMKAAIDAPNILYFEFVSNFMPSISFAKTSSEWKSLIYVWCSSSFLELNELLKALSQSQISLDIFYPPWTTLDTYGDSCEPVVVEHLRFRGFYSSSLPPGLLSYVLRTCRPRYIGVFLCSSTQARRKRVENQLAESIWKILLKEGETGQCEF